MIEELQYTPDRPTPVVPVQQFRTMDSRFFPTREAAELHQEEVETADWATKMLKAGYSVAEILEATGKTVPDLVLDLVTKDSKLVISHWQCCDGPGYKPRLFDIGMQSLYVHGHAGSWSGAYGNSVSLDSLVRYAKDPGSVLQEEPTKAEKCTS